MIALVDERHPAGRPFQRSYGRDATEATADDNHLRESRRLRFEGWDAALSQPRIDPVTTRASNDEDRHDECPGKANVAALGAAEQEQQEKEERNRSRQNAREDQQAGSQEQRIGQDGRHRLHRRCNAPLGNGSDRREREPTQCRADPDPQAEKACGTPIKTDRVQHDPQPARARNGDAVRSPPEEAVDGDGPRSVDGDPRQEHRPERESVEGTDGQQPQTQDGDERGRSRRQTQRQADEHPGRDHQSGLR